MGGPATIDGKDHDETDNFLICSFTVDGVTYPSAEHYFQVQKATNDNDKDKIRSSKTAMNSWVLGNKIKMRSDWEKVKVSVMYEGNKAKFEQNENFAEELKASQGDIVFHNSTLFWNKWNGIIIKRIRAELRGTEEDLKIAEELKSLMEEYAAQK